MASLIYSPGIRVHVKTSNPKVGVLDISKDIADFNLQRIANGVSTFSFSLQNVQRKYDRLLQPGDQITVHMRRIVWMQVFAGTLNTVPVFSAFSKKINLSASCTLKKLQMFYWDPSSQKAVNLIEQFFANVDQSGGAVNNGTDGGTSKMITDVLSQVAGWKSQQIHIGAIPDAWFDFATELQESFDKVNDMKAVLGSNTTLGGTYSGVANPLPAGTYGGLKLDEKQGLRASQVYKAWQETGMPPAAFVLCMMCCWVESSLHIYANTKTYPASASIEHDRDGQDHDSVGLFQQRPSQGWGTVAECMDPNHSTKSFLSRVKGINGWENMNPGAVVQKVQVSQKPDEYQKLYNFGVAMLQAFSSQGSSQAGSVGGTATNDPTATGATGPTGQQFAQVAYNVISRNPKGHIRYRQGGDDDATVDDPRVLDCSSLVDWVYYHVFGKKWFSPRGLAAGQAKSCTPIPVELAKSIQGALLFGFSAKISHVVISLGDGRIAEAATDSNPLPEQVHITNVYKGFTVGGLIPGVDYRNAATTQEAATELSKYINAKTGMTSFQPGNGDGSVAIGGNGALVGDLNHQLISILYAATNPSGDILGGDRALMDDNPLLPWIKNAANSSMRSISSAPNGDFIAWFPDYYGIWGTAAKMTIEPIEMQGFEVQWSDQKIVTHQYVMGNLSPLLDASSGSIINGDETMSYSGYVSAISTKGVVTIKDHPEIFKAIYGKAASQQFIDQYLLRFGGRPNVVESNSVQPGKPEFFLALWYFMQSWANQFSAVVPVTFMPEIYPGMLIQVPSQDFQAYVESVNHRGSFGRSGGFFTDITISAPTRISETDNSMFNLLPLAGASEGGYHNLESPIVDDPSESKESKGADNNIASTKTNRGGEDTQQNRGAK